jgi:hypothetical protein
MTWKVGTAIERLAIGLDRVGQRAGLAIGIGEVGLEVGELAARGRVERARRGQRELRDALRERARARVLPEPLVDAREREHRLGIAGIEAQRLAQALGGAGQIVGLLAQRPDHVVHVGEFAPRLEEARERAQRAVAVTALPAPPAQLVAAPLRVAERRCHGRLVASCRRARVANSLSE